MRATDAGDAFLTEVAAIVAPDGRRRSRVRLSAPVRTSRRVPAGAPVGDCRRAPSGTPAPTLTSARAIGRCDHRARRGGGELARVGSRRSALASRRRGARSRSSPPGARPVHDSSWSRRRAAPTTSASSCPAPRRAACSSCVCAGVVLEAGGAERDRHRPHDRRAARRCRSIATVTAHRSAPLRRRSSTSRSSRRSSSAVRQLESSTRDDGRRWHDPAAYGLLVGALFDRPVHAGVRRAEDELSD